METDGDNKTSPAAGGGSGVGLLPEVEAYAYLLTVMYLVDQKEYQKVSLMANLLSCMLWQACSPQVLKCLL
jgi:hypothetical protein